MNAMAGEIDIAGYTDEELIRKYSVISDGHRYIKQVYSMLLGNGKLNKPIENLVTLAQKKILYFVKNTLSYTIPETVWSYGKIMKE